MFGPFAGRQVAPELWTLDSGEKENVLSLVVLRPFVALGTLLAFFYLLNTFFYDRYLPQPSRFISCLGTPSSPDPEVGHVVAFCLGFPVYLHWTDVEVERQRNKVDSASLFTSLEREGVSGSWTCFRGSREATLSSVALI